MTRECYDPHWQEYLCSAIIPQSFEPQLVITFLHYFATTENEPAPTGARFLDNKKFEGPIPAMVEEAYLYILKTMRKSTLVNGLYHQEIPEYPRDAVREALLNAIMHRDYSPYARASYIQVRLFADRLEIESPGCLYGSVTIETLEENQSTRNRHLMRLAEDLHLVENRGSGINTMLTEMRKATMEPPIFEDTHSAFRVTFNNRHLLEPDTLVWLKTFALQPINEQQRMALAFLHHRSRITNSDYRRLNSVDTTTATRDLRGLVQAGVIVQHDSRRWAYYTLAHTAREDSEKLLLAPQLSRKEEAVLSLMHEQGEINNEACRRLLVCDRRGATKVLQAMSEKHLIKQIGKIGRYVKYVLWDR